MYSYIIGTLEEIREDLIVVENNGIGYNIHIPSRMIDGLPPRGDMVKIYTYLYVREDNFSLFGFTSNEELSMFRMLINVSGIGPKGGLAILSALSADDIRFAIISGDAKSISSAPGIGSKTANRLIIELKDKISLEEVFSDASSVSTDINIGDSRIKHETAEALTALGYSASEAAKVLSGIDIKEEDTVENILKKALQNMSSL